MFECNIFLRRVIKFRVLSFLISFPVTMGPLTGNVFQYNKWVSKMANEILVRIAHAQKPSLNANVGLLSMSRGLNIVLGKSGN